MVYDSGIMAVECMRKCPRMQEIRKGIDKDNFWSGPMIVHPDVLSSYPGVSKLLDAAEDTYDCPGPRLETQTFVEKPLFGKPRTVERQVWVCGLEERRRRR